VESIFFLLTTQALFNEKLSQRRDLSLDQRASASEKTSRLLRANIDNISDLAIMAVHCSLVRINKIGIYASWRS
jgi:hypothetical protein